MKDKVIRILKKEIVLLISSLAAIITMLFVTPSKEYLDYIDFRVLGLLFCLMAVIAGLQQNGIFLILSEKLLKGVTSTRKMCFILILLCFFSSMWITNDVALITFVPFTILILSMAKQNKYLIYCVVMETIAANLGSMLTPIGNPQNLYLYSFYQLNGWDFIKITIPFVLFSFFALLIMSLFVKKETISMVEPQFIYNEIDNVSKKLKEQEIKFKNSSTVIYIILFFICLGTVLRFIDYRVTLAFVLIGIFIIDRKVLRKVDYSLLLTFVSFFIFVGNLEKIQTVRSFIANMIESKEFFSSILLSQVISNVPAAVLLSNFTLDSKSLIIGTNVGGLGTIIASLASLISYKFYSSTEGAKPFTYLCTFTFFNIIILILLVCFYLIK
jgi:Na+/H+ antiporter NhaD/arsenite permease-like protein